APMDPGTMAASSTAANTIGIFFIEQPRDSPISIENAGPKQELQGLVGSVWNVSLICLRIIDYDWDELTDWPFGWTNGAAFVSFLVLATLCSNGFSNSVHDDGPRVCGKYRRRIAAWVEFHGFTSFHINLTLIKPCRSSSRSNSPRAGTTR